MDADRLVARLVYGVGTRLVTSEGQASLGGVYKLAAVEREGKLVPVLKISDSPEKTADPGCKRLWRLYDRRGFATADLVALERERPDRAEELLLRHPSDGGRRRNVRKEALSQVELLLAPVWEEGRRLCDFPPVEGLRARRDADLARLDPGVRRLVNPHVYHVSLSQRLWELKQDLIERERRGAPRRTSPPAGPS